METLEAIDRLIVLTINGWNSPFWDEFMWIVSAKKTWIPLYLLLIFLGIKQFGWKLGTFYVLCTIAAVGCTDFICSGIIKDSVQRYRPSHNNLLTDLLHFYSDGSGYEYKGGQYGFVSSHAGNFFALAWFTGIALRQKIKWLLPLMLILATVISYSRIYLGVHYLSDIIGGFLVGTGVALAMYHLIFKKLKTKFELEK